MLGVLKNVFLTAVFVVAATMATGSVAAVACLFMASGEVDSVDPNVVAASASAAIMAGALGGVLFSFVSLPIAAVTMPPALGLVRHIKMPRPLADCIGGGLAALLVSAAVVSAMESLARSKGGGAPGADMRLILDICALLGGAALGYFRHFLLVRERTLVRASQLAAA